MVWSPSRTGVSRKLNLLLALCWIRSSNFNRRGSSFTREIHPRALNYRSIPHSHLMIRVCVNGILSADMKLLCQSSWYLDRLQLWSRKLYDCQESRAEPNFIRVRTVTCAGTSSPHPVVEPIDVAPGLSSLELAQTTLIRGDCSGKVREIWE